MEGSKQRPVVVDLWAAWCGPCKTLGPILEKVAAERGGAFLLAKLDVDANPMVAQALGVQSIPTVVAFRDGEPVNGFVGAYPEQAINQFVDHSCRPRPSWGRRGERRGGGRGPGRRRAGLPRRAREGPANREAAVGLGGSWSIVAIWTRRGRC